MLLASWNVNSIRARQERLLRWLSLRQPDVLAPKPRDVERPEKWASTVLFHPEVREALRHVVGFALEDTFRLHQQEGGFYSWWDYRELSFPKNDGLRLDLILATPPVARACVAASIDRDERKGKQPSDHAPVLATFDLP